MQNIVNNQVGKSQTKLDTEGMGSHTFYIEEGCEDDVIELNLLENTIAEEINLEAAQKYLDEYEYEKGLRMGL